MVSLVANVEDAVADDDDDDNDDEKARLAVEM